VFEELRRIVNEIEITEFKKYKNLRQKFVSIMYSLLNKCIVPTNQMIKNLISVQESYINTYHPDFMGGANAVLNVFDINNYKDQEEKLEKLQSENRSNRNNFNFEEVSSASHKNSQF